MGSITTERSTRCFDEYLGVGSRNNTLSKQTKQLEECWQCAY